jgi:hypothetical protein
MNKDKYVFAQLIEFLNNDKFRRLVDKYDGNRYVKHLTCWNQLLALMFGQLSNRESLRDLIVALEAHQYKCVRWKRRMPKDILTDAEIELTVYKSRKDYPENLRLVRYHDKEQDREFMFLTNAMDLTAQQIDDLYKTDGR